MTKLLTITEEDMPGPANPTGDRLDVVDIIEDNGGRVKSITSSVSTSCHSAHEDGHDSRQASHVQNFSRPFTII